MNFLHVLCLCLLFFIDISYSEGARADLDYSDSDFAEFEDFDEESVVVDKKSSVPSQSSSDDARRKADIEMDFLEEEEESETNDLEREQRHSYIERDIDDEEEAAVEEDDDNYEFSHFADDEEFIGFDSEKIQGTGGKSSRNQEEPKITIAKVPLHLRSNWDSFYLEMLMMAGLLVYFINFIFGKGKNQKIAMVWFERHKTLFESNFALVGDDGKVEIEEGGLQKESENIYILWCSGRALMEGMLVELRLLKRQDLIGVISQLIRPSKDQLIVKVSLEEMDTFVFAVGTKKAAGKLVKEMTDISTYCPDKKSGENFGLGSNYVVHSELSEVSTLILRDQKFMAVINKCSELMEYFHFSDQYSGPKQQEETQATKPQQVKKTLVFAFNFPKGDLTSEALDSMKPLMQLVFYLSDKLSRLRLSKEAKVKADKNRFKVEEAFLKATHAARAEMAQNLREEKKRKERERIMNLDDPEKQRKWEEKEQKRQIKRRTPKMKTLKIKPM